MKRHRIMVITGIILMALLALAGCKPEPEGIKFSFTDRHMKPDTQLQLVPIVIPEKAEADITWSSSDPDSVEVSATGLIKAKTAGQSTITAKTDNGKKAEVVIFVHSQEGIPEWVKNLDLINAEGTVINTGKNGILRENMIFLESEGDNAFFYEYDSNDVPHDFTFTQDSANSRSYILTDDTEGTDDIYFIRKGIDSISNSDWVRVSDEGIERFHCDADGLLYPAEGSDGWVTILSEYDGSTGYFSWNVDGGSCGGMEFILREDYCLENALGGTNTYREGHGPQWLKNHNLFAKEAYFGFDKNGFLTPGSLKITDEEFKSGYMTAETETSMDFHYDYTRDGHDHKLDATVSWTTEGGSTTYTVSWTDVGGPSGTVSEEMTGLTLGDTP